MVSKLRWIHGSILINGYAIKKLSLSDLRMKLVPMDNLTQDTTIIRMCRTICQTICISSIYVWHTIYRHTYSPKIGTLLVSWTFCQVLCLLQSLPLLLRLIFLLLLGFYEPAINPPPWTINHRSTINKPIHQPWTINHSICQQICTECPRVAQLRSAGFTFGGLSCSSWWSVSAWWCELFRDGIALYS